MKSALRLLPALILALLLSAIPAANGAPAAATGSTIYLPLVAGTPPTPSAFGFDIRSWASDAVFGLAREANPRWIRAGDLFWMDIEPSPGVYHWEEAAALEQNIRRVRAAGMEPLIVIQRAPAWARLNPSRLCSPVAPNHYQSFAKFLKVAAARYNQEPLAVRYWELWNEPDTSPAATNDDDGVGCWAQPGTPDYGGRAYGDMVRQAAPAIKAVNPRAAVLAGALLYQWPDDTNSQQFISGLLDTAGRSFDYLSFHAYGEWGPNDLLLNKTVRIRALLAQKGYADLPLFATEIAAMCSVSGCPADFTKRQANFAARIFALATALKLEGALWYTLAIDSPGFRYSHLIDGLGAKPQPRPAFYAFRNSARLLQGARYIGPTVQIVPQSQLHAVQSLVFRRDRSSINPAKGSTLYVLWVADPTDVQAYPVTVPLGVRPICTDQLDGDPANGGSEKNPRTSYCVPDSAATTIYVAVGPMPKYIEVLDP